MIDKLMVVGNPIEHSLSPRIGSYIADAIGVNISYTKKCLECSNFDQELNSFFADGGLSLNITKPFKSIARDYVLDHNGIMHADIDSCNLIIMRENILQGYSTDGVGLYQDIGRVFKVNNLANHNILIIGNGGVVQSLVEELYKHNTAISVLSRNGKLIKNTSIYNANVKYDLIINTTPNTVDNQLIHKLNAHNIGKYAYDVAYSCGGNMFANIVQGLCPNVLIANGIGMLFSVIMANFSLIYGDKFDLTKPQIEVIYNKIKDL